jgi:hypothetical protein
MATTMRTTDRPTAAGMPLAGAKRQMLLGVLSGMLPLLVAIVPFMLGMWGVGLVIAVGGGLLMIGWRVAQHEPTSVLDISSAGFGVLLAIAYFGFGNDFFLRHFGVVIYSLLLLQVVVGEVGGRPFTAQYSKRMFPAEVLGTRAFFEGNRFLSRVWSVIFLVAIGLSAFGTDTLTLIVVPNGLVIVALVFGPNMGHWYVQRFVVTGVQSAESARS